MHLCPTLPTTQQQLLGTTTLTVMEEEPGAVGDHGGTATSQNPVTFNIYLAMCMCYVPVCWFFTALFSHWSNLTHKQHAFL